MLPYVTWPGGSFESFGSSPPLVEKGNRLRMQISGIEWKSTVFEQYRYHIEIVSVVCEKNRYRIEIVSVVCEKIDIVSRSFSGV